LGGRDIARMPIGTLRKHMKLMITPPAFFDARIEENLKIAGIETHSPDLKTLFHALSLPMPFLNKKASELSYGEQQRLNLVRALLVRPQLLLLDEPTQGLDARLIEDVFRLLMGLCQEEGLGLLIASHTDLPDFVRSDTTFRRITLSPLTGKGSF
jgi:ABC-type multidrug transport system ATPase subunit